MLHMPLCMQAMEASEAPSPSTPDRKADAQYAEPALKVVSTEAFQRYQRSAAEAAAHPPEENGQAPAAEVRCGPKHFACQNRLYVKVRSLIPSSRGSLWPQASLFRVQCFRCLISSTWRQGAHLYSIPGQAGRKLESMINLAEPEMMLFRACRLQRRGAIGQWQRFRRQPQVQEEDRTAALVTGHPQAPESQAHGMQEHAKYWFTHADDWPSLACRAHRRGGRGALAVLQATATEAARGGRGLLHDHRGQRDMGGMRMQRQKARLLGLPPKALLPVLPRGGDRRRKVQPLQQHRLPSPLGASPRPGSTW